MRDAEFAPLGLLPPARRVPLPGGVQTAAEALDAGLAANPDKEVLVGRYRRFTFAGLDAVINAAAAFFARELGLGAGDRIAAAAPNHPDIVIAFMAAMRLGAIWVGVNRPLAPPEKRYILEDSGSAVFLADPDSLAQIVPLRADLPALRHVVEMRPEGGGDFWPGVARHAGAARPAVEIDPWAPAVIAYTSGTTGLPKGAVHSQHNMMLVPEMYRSRWPRAAASRRGVALPLTIPNLMILGPLMVFRNLATLVCMDRIDAAGVVEWIRTERIEAATLPPAVIYDLITNPAFSQDDLASYVFPGTGGTAFPGDFARLFRARFGTGVQMTYGQTEVPTIATQTDPAEPDLPGSSGRAMPHLRIRILDAEDREVPAGEIGEVGVMAAEDGPFAQCYTPMLGYWGKPEATRSALRNGMLHTGDLGLLDAAGNLFIRDRKNDLIIRGGSNVYPAEIERVLMRDARVRDCAVLGRPDLRLGERVAAFIEADPAVDSAALIADLRLLCAAELAKYKQPEEWITIARMPRNAMQKIIKRELAKHFATGPDVAADG